MKRSKKVILPSMCKDWSKFGVATVSITVGAALMTGCSEASDKNTNISAKLFKNIKDCTDNKPGYSQSCKAAYERALKEALRTSPRYSKLEDCRHDFPKDGCFKPSLENIYMPVMGAFTFSPKLVKNRYRSNQYYSEPIYRHDESWHAANGDSYGSYRKTDTIKMGKSELEPKPTVTRTISRGGFGSTVSARSTWTKSASNSSGSGSTSRSSSRSWGGWGG